jgi:glycine cleavage system protein P-like pyridoxal-binding family
MAGLKVVSVKVLADGSLDLDDLRAKAEKHKEKLAAFMVSVSQPGVYSCSDCSADHLSFYLWRL